MREIRTEEIARAVKEALLRVNYQMGADVMGALRECREKDRSPLSREVLGHIIQNNEIAAKEQVAICQDTGMAIVFAEVGQEVHIVGGGFRDAVDQGVREAYQDGYLRKSIVSDPLYDRINTKDNTPAVLYTDLVDGDGIRLTIAAKGFGSENMSRIKMMVPADGEQGVLNFIEETVRLAGPNPCPPVVVGVCVGGPMDKAAQLAKRATLRPIGSQNADKRYQRLERMALDRLNGLGIGAGGLGGDTTALAVNIEWYPTHIAGMPVAVNVCCHVARHCIVEL